MKSITRKAKKTKFIHPMKSKKDLNEQTVSKNKRLASEFDVNEEIHYNKEFEDHNLDEMKSSRKDINAVEISLDKIINQSKKESMKKTKENKKDILVKKKSFMSTSVKTSDQQRKSDAIGKSEPVTPKKIELSFSFDKNEKQDSKKKGKKMKMSTAKISPSYIKKTSNGKIIQFCYS